MGSSKSSVDSTPKSTNTPKPTQTSSSSPSNSIPAPLSPTPKRKPVQVPVKTGPTKIRSAAVTMARFLSSVMCPSDRCSVVAFNDKYMPLLNLGTKNEGIVVMDVLQRHCSGTTHLWDAMAVSILQFIETANRSRPWILIVLTDGDDTGSELGMCQVANLMSRFNAPSNNFTFVVGLGRSVNSCKLRQICNQGNGIYLPATDTEALHAMFAMIALQVVEGVKVDLVGVRTQHADALFARVQQYQAIRRQAIDILLLVDISGSMKET